MIVNDLMRLAHAVRRYTMDPTHAQITANHIITHNIRPSSISLMSISQGLRFLGSTSTMLAGEMVVPAVIQHVSSLCNNLNVNQNVKLMEDDIREGLRGILLWSSWFDPYSRNVMKWLIRQVQTLSTFTPVTNTLLEWNVGTEYSISDEVAQEFVELYTNLIFLLTKTKQQYQLYAYLELLSMMCSGDEYNTPTSPIFTACSAFFRNHVEIMYSQLLKELACNPHFLAPNVAAASLCLDFGPGISAIPKPIIESILTSAVFGIEHLNSQQRLLCWKRSIEVGSMYSSTFAVASSKAVDTMSMWECVEGLGMATMPQSNCPTSVINTFTRLTKQHGIKSKDPLCN
eukprot:PhF_6_TR43629/c0_g1_i2/m.67026